MELQATVEALVKAAIGLAIVRNDLVTEDEGEMDDDIRESICEDAWNAVRGIDTCSGECPEWQALQKALGVR